MNDELFKSYWYALFGMKKEERHPIKPTKEMIDEKITELYTGTFSTDAKAKKAAALVLDMVVAIPDDAKDFVLQSISLLSGFSSYSEQ